MFKRFNGWIMLESMIMSAFLILCSSPVLASTNLLTNPGAESGGTGWVTIQNGGNGMSYTFDGFVRSGSQSFQTSFGLDSISQQVDLFANGYSTSSMVTSPDIYFSVWFFTRPDQAGRYYAKFSLLEQDGSTVVNSRSFGSPSALVAVPGGTGWTEVSYTFSNYGGGIRYVAIEFGGRDQSSWAGNYGTHFDDASISVATVSAGADTTGGGNPMPWWGYVPPKGPFAIALSSGGSMASTTEAMLNLSASPDVDRMALSRTEDFKTSGIVPFSTTLPWSICGAQVCTAGLYDVYAKFYQSYGLSSPVQHLAIAYAPVESIALPSATTTSSSISIASPESRVFRFTRNLRLGDQDSDVKRLQEFMNTHGFILAKSGTGSPGKETDVFGPALKRMIVRFQEANKEKLLTPLGLKKGTGIFSTQTRKAVNALLDD